MDWVIPIVNSKRTHARGTERAKTIDQLILGESTINQLNLGVPVRRLGGPVPTQCKLQIPCLLAGPLHGP